MSDEEQVEIQAIIRDFVHQHQLLMAAASVLDSPVDKGMVNDNWRTILMLARVAGVVIREIDRIERLVT
jgi:hypothetical protein